MGNCLRKESSTQWGGDDWGSFTSNDKTRTHQISDLENSIDALVGEKSGVFGERGTVIKIKISRKQLEQLLKKTDDVSAEQVLAQLTNASDPSEAHQRQWRPALQTIPE